MDLLTDIQEFEIAKIIDRVAAFILDFFVFGAVGLIIGMLWGTPHAENIGYNLNGWPAAVFMCAGVFLWPISEGIWGQTIGKRLFNLKTVKDNYEPIGFGLAFVRFFGGYIDMFFLMGLIIAKFNKSNKRIGDLIAHTIVIKI